MKKKFRVFFCRLASSVHCHIHIERRERDRVEKNRLSWSTVNEKKVEIKFVEQNEHMFSLTRTLKLHCGMFLTSK